MLVSFCQQLLTGCVMWRRLAVAGVVCGMATPRAGIAQLLELQPGAKVRVTAPPILGTRYDAVVGSRSGDTLWLVRVGSPTVQVPVSALESVQLSRGRSRAAGAKRGVLWGGRHWRGDRRAVDRVVAFSPQRLRQLRGVHDQHRERPGVELRRRDGCGADARRGAGRGVVGCGDRRAGGPRTVGVAERAAAGGAATGQVGSRGAGRRSGGVLACGPGA